ncbi:hypothetical protein ACVNPS_07945 [Candidatus Bipolaricaulota sp. J31]
MRAVFYLPQIELEKLPFLIALRILSFVGLLYALFRVKRIAPVLDIPLLLGWSLRTAWEVCYFLFL